MSTILQWCGRFGNNIQQISNAIYHCKKNFLQFNSPDNDLVRRFDIGFGEDGRSESGLFFFHLDSQIGSGRREFEFDIEDIRKERRNICREYIYPMLKIDFEKVSDLGEETVVIHIRSGDIFNRNNFYCPVVSNYIQNPLSYYKEIIDLYENAIILTEDHNNPIIAELSKIEKVDIRILSVEESIQTMLSARNLATSGVSSFGIACALLSRNIRRLYCSSIYLDEVLNYNEFYDPSVEIIIKEIEMEKYIRFGEWKNTEEQRLLMLRYPNIGHAESKRIKIFMTGPIRPSKESTIRCIDNIRRQFKDCEIFLSTWKTSEKIEEIRDRVDYLIESEEPSIEEFFSTSGISSINSYRMVYGMSKIFDFIEEKNMNLDGEIIIRTRTDLFVDFNSEIESIIDESDIDFYVAYDQMFSGASFSDWIGISKYEYMKAAWYYSSDENGKAKFKSDFTASYNPENMVKRNLNDRGIKIVHFEKVSYPENIAMRYGVLQNSISQGDCLRGSELKDIFLIRNENLPHLINVSPDRAYIP